MKRPTSYKDFLEREIQRLELVGTDNALREARKYRWEKTRKDRRNIIDRTANVLHNDYV